MRSDTDDIDKSEDKSDTDSRASEVEAFDVEGWLAIPSAAALVAALEVEGWLWLEIPPAAALEVGVELEVAIIPGTGKGHLPSLP